MQIKEVWAQNGDVKIHYLTSSGPVNDRWPPLMYVPGMLGTAETFKNEMRVFFPRPCIAISLRGCGKSDAPREGYALDDYVSDIEAVVNKSDVAHFYLMAYSMGVPYAIEYAARHPKKVKGLVLCDYPASLPKIPQEWISRVLSNRMLDTSREHVVYAIQAEFKHIALWDRLKNIECPVLLIRGGKDDSRVKDDDVIHYHTQLSQFEDCLFADTGHELWKPDYNRFMNTVKHFMENSVSF